MTGVTGRLRFVLSLACMAAFLWLISVAADHAWLEAKWYLVVLFLGLWLFVLARQFLGSVSQYREATDAFVHRRIVSADLPPDFRSLSHEETKWERSIYRKRCNESLYQCISIGRRTFSKQPPLHAINCHLIAALIFAWAFSSNSAKGADTSMTPRLDISKANNLITLSWPSWAIYFKPWSTTNLSPRATWSPMTNPITVTNAQCSLTFAISNSQGFFRLIDSQPSLQVGLIAHYTFDEQCTNSAAGCVKDSSGLGNDGTLGSATSGTLPQAPIWTANGGFAGAYLYNGIVQPGEIIATIGQGMYLPQGVDVDGNWTLSVWAKLNNVTNHTSGTIYSQKQSTEDCRNLLIHWEGDFDETMTLQVRDSACHELILHNLPSNPMVAGQWYHLVGVGNNKTYSFYINGELQESQIVSNMGSLSSNSHTIGTMFDDGGSYYNHYLDGSVDEMRIYNRALSDSEILALYNQSGGSFP
jgi:hypothetical protein